MKLLILRIREQGVDCLGEKGNMWSTLALWINYFTSSEQISRKKVFECVASLRRATTKFWHAETIVWISYIVPMSIFEAGMILLTSD